MIFSASCDRRLEDVRVSPIIIMELELREIDEEKSNLHLVGVCVNRIGTVSRRKKGRHR